MFVLTHGISKFTYLTSPTVDGTPKPRPETSPKQDADSAQASSGPQTSRPTACKRSLIHSPRGTHTNPPAISSAASAQTAPA